jgi:hypothetical protein
VPNDVGATTRSRLTAYPAGAQRLVSAARKKTDVTKVYVIPVGPRISDWRNLAVCRVTARPAR